MTKRFGRRAAANGLVADTLMHDGDPTSSLPWDAAGCMTNRAEARKREMSKQATRQETERLAKEALERKAITIEQGKTRIESKCAKCGALNRVSAAKGRFGCHTRVRNVEKNKGHSEKTQPAGYLAGNRTR